MINMSGFIDLTNKRFNRLKVISINKEKINKKSIYWNCLCDCGKYISVRGDSLRNKNTQSCGCYRIEQTKKKNKRFNRYLLYDNYGIGYLDNKNIFYFDIEDFYKIKDYKWYPNPEGYILSTIRISGKNKTIRMHRLIMGLVEGDNIVIDHINHCVNDNRKNNIRIVTTSQNASNSRRPPNASGCRGVYWFKRDKLWQVFIYHKNKDIYLGRYKNIEEAIKTRKKAEIKYFGEYRYKGE